MKKIITTGLAAGVSMLAVNMLIVNPVISFLFPSFQSIYEDAILFRQMEEPIMMLFFLYPIVLGFAFAWLWNKFKHEAGEGMFVQAQQLTTVYFFMAVLPAFCINLGSFNLPALMVVSWALMSIVNGLVGGLVLAKLNPKE